MKDGLSETPSIGDWIVSNIPPNSLVGIDTTLYGENLFQTLANKLKENSCELVDTKQNLVDIVRDECEKTEFKMESLVKLDVAHTGYLFILNFFVVSVVLTPEKQLVNIH